MSIVNIRAGVNGKSSTPVIVPEDFPETLPSLTEGDAPEFPTSTLTNGGNPWLENFVKAAAESTQTDEGMAAILGLSALAIAVQDKVVVQGRPGWLEVPCLYSLTVAAPGTGKSNVFKPATAPIREYERDYNAARSGEISIAAARREAMAFEVERMKKDKAVGGLNPDPAAVARLNDAVRALGGMRVEKPRTFLVDDITNERLASIMADNGGCLGLLTPEGDLFDIISGRYQNGRANLGVYLRAWGGESLKVDRKDRAESIECAVLTLALMTQPSVLQGLAGRDSFLGRGFLDRFIYNVPKNNIGYQKTGRDRPPIPDSVALAYHAALTRLLELPSERTVSGGNWERRVLSYSREAQEDAYHFEQEVMERRRPNAEWGEEYTARYAAKLGSHVHRIAALLHIAAHVNDADPLKGPIEPTTFARAKIIAESFIMPHAIKALGSMLATSEESGAERIARWIKENKAAVWSLREARTQVRGCEALPDTDAWYRALRTLIDGDYIKEVDTGRTYRKVPVKCYVSHPDLCGRRDHYAVAFPDGDDITPGTTFSSR